MSSEPLTPVIEIRDAAASSGRDAARTSVTDINWTVAAGEFWVVGGAQHSGKTDLLMLAAGLTPPATGTHRLFGRATTDFDEAEVASRLRVGFVFEHGQLFNHLTLAENIALPLRYHRNLDEVEAERETAGLLDLLELTPRADFRPPNVNRDWIKRAALARALVLRPQLLLCDHPLSGVGSRHRPWWPKFLGDLCRGHELLGGQPVTVVVTAEEFAPWRKAGSHFALLHYKKFFPLGAWENLAAEPAATELLFTHPESTN